MFFLITDHLLDDPRNTGIAHGAFTNKATITENGDEIANLHQLFQTMGDINDGDTTALQLCDHIEKDFYFRLAEGRCRFIHNQYPGIFRKGTGNLHQLLMANT